MGEENVHSIKHWTKSQTLLIRLEFDATIEEDAKFQLELMQMKMHFADLVWVFFLSIQIQRLWPN